MRGSGTVEARGPGAWRLRIDAPPDPVTHARRRLTKTVHVKTERAARQALARWLVEVEQEPRERSGTDLTVARVAERWFAGFLEQTVTGDKSPYSAARDRGILDLYIIPHIGHIAVRKLTTFDLDRLYGQLLTEGGVDGRRLAPATVRKVHGVLRRILSTAVRWQWISVNPALSAAPPGTQAKEPIPPDTAQAKRLLEEAERVDPEWAAFLRVSAAAGLRRGEVCALRWRDVDLEAGTLTVARAIAVDLNGDLVERERPKTARGRRQVALDVRTIFMLRAQRQAQRERALVCGTGLAKNGFVFAREPDGSVPWTPKVVTTRFMRLRNRLGVGVRLHDLRHYVATQLLAAGVDVRTVAGRLGQDPAVTLRTYAHFVPAKDREAADVIAGLLDG